MKTLSIPTCLHDKHDTQTSKRRTLMKTLSIATCLDDKNDTVHHFEKRRDRSRLSLRTSPFRAINRSVTISSFGSMNMRMSKLFKQNKNIHRRNAIILDMLKKEIQREVELIATSRTFLLDDDDYYYDELTFSSSDDDLLEIEPEKFETKSLKEQQPQGRIIAYNQFLSLGDVYHHLPDFKEKMVYMFQRHYFWGSRTILQIYAMFLIATLFRQVRLCLYGIIILLSYRVIEKIIEFLLQYLNSHDYHELSMRSTIIINFIYNHTEELSGGNILRILWAIEALKVYAKNGNSYLRSYVRSNLRSQMHSVNEATVNEVRQSIRHSEMLQLRNHHLLEEY